MMTPEGGYRGGELDRKDWAQFRITLGLCPICGLSGGFHGDHRAARDNIPRELLKEKGWQSR